MKRIFLIYGNPKSGKSTLGKDIKGRVTESGNSCELISVDDQYVYFITQHFPALRFEALNQFIAPHYFWLNQWRQAFHKCFGQDPIDAWHQHLLDFIKKQSILYDDLAVEGYLLEDCKDQFEKNLSDRAKIFQVYVNEKQYFVGNNIATLEEILKLGEESG